MERDASHVALEPGGDSQDTPPPGGGTKEGEQCGAADVAQPAMATQPTTTQGAAAGPADETAPPSPRQGSNSTSRKVREAPARKTMELMSQGGLHLKDILGDPSNDSTPVEAMRSIMVRGKEHGWTTSQLFGVFLETFDTDGSGTIELSEFIRWCLDIDTMAWKAERVRRTTGGQTSGGHGKRGDGEIGIDEAAARMAGEVAQAQLPPEQPRFPLGTLIYEGSKLFWRTGESLRIAMHENKEKHCIAISTMLEGESEPFPVLKVDSRLIRVNGKDAVLERIAEMTEADKGEIQRLPEDARAKLFDKARASVLSDYLLARLKLIDGRDADGNATDTQASAAAISAAARLGLGGVGPGTAPESASTARAPETPAEPVEPPGEVSLPVTKSDSIFPIGTPTPVVVKLPEDDGGESGSFLLEDELVFSELHTFSKHVSYKDFKRVENEVSEGLKDGHDRIENADKAQRRAHGSLENPHHRTSAFFGDGAKPLLSSSSTPTTTKPEAVPRTSANAKVSTGRVKSSVSRKSGSGGTTLPPTERTKRTSSHSQRPATGGGRRRSSKDGVTRRRSSKEQISKPPRKSGGGGGAKGGSVSTGDAASGAGSRLSASLSRPTASSAERNTSRVTGT
ncbi:conserved unknown protein [Ectocarpus siliculosus]|uniref:EF-hand domain-containing protein n=1 Tax=Ectocarpus siliculosus TaxID=2880 RepID=D8LCP2_ECTSI|nr:conserved unknown protein [Ectocarpus siliculosus]|eukprot:CBN79555.1 conserved unknown protein [Ectocarpus siliculosus]